MKYDPTGTPTFLGLVPIDAIQGAADLIAMKQAGCGNVAVADDGGVYGTGLAKVLQLGQSLYGVTIASRIALDPRATSFASYGSQADHAAGRSRSAPPPRRLASSRR